MSYKQKVEFTFLYFKYLKVIFFYYAEIDFFVERSTAGSHQQGAQPEKKFEAQEQVTVTSQWYGEAGKGRCDK